MAWTAPMTATENTAWTSSQWNTHVRDNLNETSPAKATAAARYLVSNGTNTIAERVPSAASVATSQTTTSTTYADLATVGPAVTVTTGTHALVMHIVRQNTSGSNSCWASHAVSGATTISANDEWATRMNETNDMTISAVKLHTGLTAGSNTFTMKYKQSTSGTATFVDRRITVLPF